MLSREIDFDAKIVFENDGNTSSDSEDFKMTIIKNKNTKRKSNVKKLESDEKLKIINKDISKDENAKRKSNVKKLESDEKLKIIDKKDIPKDENAILKKTPKIPQIITKEWLVDRFNKLESSGDTINYIGKFKFTKDYSYYMDHIYDTHDVDNFEAELEFCETDDQKEMWLFMRLKMSSFEYTSNSCGRYVKILIRDKKTKKYVGVASMGSDVSCSLYDKYIGWDKNTKFKNGTMMNYLMNITTCVGIPPFSFNFNGGKLITLLMFSQEVYDYVYKKYKQELACITTFSLYGKSVQYDRIQELKYVGLTNGETISHLPKWFYDCIVTYTKQQDDFDEKKFNRRLNQMTYLIRKYDLPKEFMKGVQKGCYIGFTGTNSKEFLMQKDKKLKVNLKTVSEISSFWKERWAVSRYANLLSTSRVMIDCNYDTSIIDEKDYNRLKKIQAKLKKNDEPNKKKLTYLEKIEILSHYNKNKKSSMLEMEKLFSEKFDKKIGRHSIKKLIHCIDT